jgi:uncharacterized OB-fold protein
LAQGAIEGEGVKEVLAQVVADPHRDAIGDRVKEVLAQVVAGPHEMISALNKVGLKV